MPFFVYILKSQRDGSFYKGYTEDLKTRLHIHNSGKVRSTKAKRPLELSYYEEHETLEQALDREKYLKSAAGRRFINKLNLK